MKHSVKVNVVKPGDKATVLKGKTRRFFLPFISRLMDGTIKILILSPGDTVNNISIEEIKGGN